MSAGARELERWLERSGWTATELAAELEVTPAVVSSWRHGRYRPTLEHALELERVAGIPVAAWAHKR